MEAKANADADGDARGGVRVMVRLHANLARYAPDPSGKAELRLPVGSTVEDALRQFPLPADRRINVGLNGEAADPGQELANGDQLDLLTPMAGG
jgi:sulfur carrier protein ThiS